jgi:hypothetical protein
MEAILAEYGRIPDPAADDIEADFQKRAKLVMAEWRDFSSSSEAPRPTDPLLVLVEI